MRQALRDLFERLHGYELTPYEFVEVVSMISARVKYPNIPKESEVNVVCSVCGKKVVVKLALVQAS